MSSIRLPRRLLIVHNDYLHRGGEEACVAREAEALRASGLDVREFHVTNGRGLSTSYNAILAPFGKGYEGALEREVERWKPDILHVHNLFPQLSPRIFRTTREYGVRTLMTLHNFRPLCMNGLFMTPALEICERCAIQGRPGPGVLRGCYRQSRIQSAALAAHLSYARGQGWYKMIDRFIAPSRFLRDKFVAYGFAKERFVVQGHFLDIWPAEKPVAPEPYVLYLGRLSKEKGVQWLLNAFREPRIPFTLKVAGRGPLEAEVKRATGNSIEYLGYMDGQIKEDYLKRATALIMPSECYENFPLAIMEANAWGTPALVSDLGGLAEMVKSDENGRTFTPGDVNSFWRTLTHLRETFGTQAARRHCQDYAKKQFSQTAFLTARQFIYKNLLDV